MSPTSQRLRLVVLATGFLVLSGCAMTDPYRRPGVWRPMGSNEMNLELQVAHAADMVKGRSADDSDGQTAAAAVDRLYNDKVKKLPASGISKIGGSDSAAGGSGGGGQGGGS